MRALIEFVDVSDKYQQEEFDQIGLNLMADMAEVGTGTMPIPDATGTLEYYSGSEFQLLDGSVAILNGFVGGDTIGRGSTAGGDRRLPGITIADENATLWGARAYRWRRPAETDRARVLAFAARYNPDLDTTWVLNTHLKNLPAKTYTTEEIVTDLLGDMADVTGKTMFVVNRDLHWHLYTEGDTAGLAISDDDTEYDYVTTFPPMNPSKTRDPSDLANNVLAYNDKGQTYRATDAGSLTRYDQHIRHQRLVAAPDSSLANLESRAKGVIARGKDERTTYECDIGPLTAAQYALIPKGSLISVTSAVMGLNHSTQRIAQMDVKYKHPGRYFLHLVFSFPIRTVAPPSPVPPVSNPTPFVPGVGTITFIQAAKTADGTTGGDVTLGAAATAGNLLVIATEPDQPGGATPAWDVLLPDGFVMDVESHGITDDSGGGTTLGRAIGSKDAAGGETLLEVRWGPAGTVTPTTTPNGMAIVAEYEASDALVLAQQIPFVVQDDGAGTTTLSGITPQAGAAALIAVLVGFHPNYAPTVSAGWNIRGSWDATGGSRLRLMLVDRIENSAAGSYSLTLTSPGGTDSTGWVLGAAVYEVGGGVPGYGQPTGPEGATGDGVSTQRQTNYPYVQGSLVVKVNGVITVVTETDPANGLFNYLVPPPVGANESWTYQATGGDPTGATNPPATTPPEGVPSGPGTVQGGDGVYRQPLQEYTPAEAPDGSRTTFTIVPYVAGSAVQLAIGTQTQRKDTDWRELDPAAGTIAMDEAPITGEEIRVWAMPLVATPTGTSFGNGPLVGSGLNLDSKANIQDGPEGKIAHVFKAATSSTLVKCRLQRRGGPVYSGGTGGTESIRVYALDANGHPTGSALATQANTPGNPGGAWTTYDEITWSSPATLVAGTRYAVTIQNTDGSPMTNYISINDLYVFGSSPIPGGQGRQPLFADADWAVLVDGGSGWALRDRFTADMELTYGNATVQGMGYIQNFETTTYSGGTPAYGVVNGASKKVREIWTQVGNATIASIAARMRRTYGSDPATLELLHGSGAGTHMTSVVVPASMIPQSGPGLDNGGSAWAAGRTDTLQALVNGEIYQVVISCPSTSQYTLAPIRKGTDQGFTMATVFNGSGEFTTNGGASWARLYPFDTDAPDLQFYMGKAT